MTHDESHVHRDEAERGRREVSRWVLVQGALLMVLGLGLTYSAYQDDLDRDRLAAQEAAQDRRDAAQDRCVVQVMRALADSLGARQKFTQDESDATARVLSRFASGKVTTDAQAKAVLDRYARERKKIRMGRNANPIPALPTGQCEVGTKQAQLPPVETPSPAAPTSKDKPRSRQNGSNDGAGGSGGASGTGDRGGSGGSGSGDSGNGGGGLPTVPGGPTVGVPGLIEIPLPAINTLLSDVRQTVQDGICKQG